MGTRDGERRSRAPWVALGVAALAVALDQGSKAWALAHLTVGEFVPVLGDVFAFQLVSNSGAAFSLGSGSTWVFTVVASVILVVIAVALPRLRDLPTAVAVGLLGGGALGNLLDRLVQPPSFGSGHVVDFLNYGGLFVGNVADIWIVGAALWLALAQLIAPARGRAEGQDRSPADGPERGPADRGGGDA